MKGELGAKTRRFYSAMQADFLSWVEDEGLTFPVSIQEVSLYLRSYVTINAVGKTAIAARRSAIAHLYRSRGIDFDTKAISVESIMAKPLRFRLKNKGGT